MYLAGVLTFYRQDATDFVLRMWWRVCQRFSLEQFKAAVDAHVADPEQGRFVPMPAHIIKLLEGSRTERSQVAWGKVLQAMVHVGAYCDVCFDEGLIHRVVADLGGWAVVCRTPVKELGYLQHRFCESYRAYAGDGAATLPCVLVGDRGADELYVRRGLPVPAPVLVGEQLRCAQVMHGGVAAGDSMGDRTGGAGRAGIVRSVPRAERAHTAVAASGFAADQAALAPGVAGEAR